VARQVQAYPVKVMTEAEVGFKIAPMVAVAVAAQATLVQMVRVTPEETVDQEPRLLY
jgi:hypothetical protein